MAVMMAKLSRALRSANVPEDQAREAAEEIAGFESMRGQLTLLRWMVGFNLALTVTIVGKLFLGLQPALEAGRLCEQGPARDGPDPALWDGGKRRSGPGCSVGRTAPRNLAAPRHGHTLTDDRVAGRTELPKSAGSLGHYPTQLPIAAVRPPHVVRTQEGGAAAAPASV